MILDADAIKICNAILNVNDNSTKIVDQLTAKGFTAGYSLMEDDCIVLEKRDSDGCLDFKVKIFDCSKADPTIIWIQLMEDDVNISRVKNLDEILKKLKHV